MNQRPGKDHGREREQQMNDEMPARLTLFHADEKSNREQCSAGGDHDKKENQRSGSDLVAALVRVFCAAVSSELSPNQAQG